MRATVIDERIGMISSPFVDLSFFALFATGSNNATTHVALKANDRRLLPFLLACRFLLRPDLSWYSYLSAQPSSLSLEPSLS